MSLQLKMLYHFLHLQAVDCACSQWGLELHASSHCSPRRRWSHKHQYWTQHCEKALLIHLHLAGTAHWTFKMILLFFLCWTGKCGTLRQSCGFGGEYDPLLAHHSDQSQKMSTGQTYRKKCGRTCLKLCVNPEMFFIPLLVQIMFLPVNRAALTHECMGLRFWGRSPHSGRCLRSSYAAALISSIRQKLTPGARRSWRTRTSCCSSLTSETFCHSCRVKLRW